MELALILTIVGCIAAGVTGAVAATWGLRVKVFQLETELLSLKESHVSQVRKGAAHERWKKQDVIEEAKQLALAARGNSAERNPWDF